jgi:hypothetical protein
MIFRTTGSQVARVLIARLDLSKTSGQRERRRTETRAFRIDGAGILSKYADGAGNMSQHQSQKWAQNALIAPVRFSGVRHN